MATCNIFLTRRNISHLYHKGCEKISPLLGWKELFGVMAVNNVVHVNECGLPLNAINWLETHHQSKAFERRQDDSRLATPTRELCGGCGLWPWSMDSPSRSAIGPDRLHSWGGYLTRSSGHRPTKKCTSLVSSTSTI